MNNRTRTLTAVAATALLQFSLSYAQQSSATATLTGRVVDGTTGEPIVGATVQVVGAKLGAYTNVSGAYTIRNLPTGLHSLKVTSVGYGPKTIENVKVDGGRGITQDISLVPQAIQGKEVVITADAGKQTENAALIERKRSTQVSDAISAQEISKAPAADAGDAMKRVTGVSVVGGRYVVVRGLSERYSATQLNGVNLPSPEPEKKVVEAEKVVPAQELVLKKSIAIRQHVKDEKQPAYVRNNLKLFLARALTNRRLHEDGLALLRTLTPE